MIPVGWDEILSRSSILYKLYLAITCKNFNPGKVESFFCTAGISLYRDKIFPDRCYFYCIFTKHTTSICEKKVNKCLYRISPFCEQF